MTQDLMRPRRKEQPGNRLRTLGKLLVPANRWLVRFEQALLLLERRLTIAGTALLIAAMLMFVAMLEVHPGLTPISHGIYYAQLSEHPFEPAGNPNAHRILTPLAAYLTFFLRGDRLVYVNLAVALVLLALIYGHYRTADTPDEQSSPLLAFSLTAMMALTMPTLFTIHFGGYTDSTTYLLTFLMLVCGARPLVFWLLFLLALLNRESVLFLVPFFSLWHYQRLRDPRRFAVSLSSGLGATIVTYFLFRLALNDPTVAQHSTAFYLEPLLTDPFHGLRQVAAGYPVGLFSAFRFFWLLPMAALVVALRKHNYLMALLVLLPICCAMAQSIIAVDTSRMIALAFPAFLVSALIVRTRIGERPLSAALLAFALLSLVMPQYYVTSNEVSTMRSSMPAIARRVSGH